MQYAWYYRNAGSSKWHKSSIRDNTYDAPMIASRAGREVYCVITDAYGNTVTSDVVKIHCTASITSQPTDVYAAIGSNFCVTVKAEGEGLQYTWYYRNAGSSKWHKSSVRDNTYDATMTAARADREVYCVITDAYGNSVTTNIVKISCTTS